MTTPVPTPGADRDVPQSAWVLVAANAVPLAGVLFFHWSIFAIVLLYWCENVVVGAFNVLKILFAEPQEFWANASKLFLIPFFIVHYGMFTFVHGIFVLVFFGPHDGMAPSVDLFESAIRQAGIGIGVLAVILSHGYSFFQNYLFSGEYRRMSPQVLMAQPYGRVVVMHVTILAGGIATMSLGSPVAVVVVLIVLKTAIDYRAHLSERRKLGEAAAA
jgi:hypothetical protein